SLGGRLETVDGDGEGERATRLELRDGDRVRDPAGLGRPGVEEVDVTLVVGIRYHGRRASADDLLAGETVYRGGDGDADWRRRGRWWGATGGAGARGPPAPPAAA